MVRKRENGVHFTSKHNLRGKVQDLETGHCNAPSEIPAFPAECLAYIKKKTR